MDSSHVPWRKRMADQTPILDAALHTHLPPRLSRENPSIQSEVLIPGAA